MRIWEKSYLYTLTLFIIVFFASIFVVIHTSFSAALGTARNTAIRDAHFIARAVASDITALEDRRNATDITITNVFAPYEEYYIKNGISLSLSRNDGTFYGSADLPVSAAGGFENSIVCDIVSSEGKKFVRVADALQGPAGAYTLGYAKNIDEIYRRHNERVLFLVLLSVGISLLLAAGLYFTIRRLYRPLGNLAHELRTPLTAIRGYAEYLQIAAISDDERYTATKYIVDESHRLADVTDKLLIMANLREGGITHEKVDIRTIFENTKMTLKRVDYDIEQPSFYGDKTLLQSLVNNLAANAIGASDSGQHVLLKAHDNTIEIIDHGMGMSAAELAFANNPNKRKKTRRSKDGSGLGLLLCHQIAALHSARLTFESDLGVGTTARITFTKR